MYECIVGHHNTDAEKAAQIEDSVCCMPCAVANNHPGKFQQYSCSSLRDFYNHCAESMGKALILYAWSLDGAADEFMGPDGWGTIERFDNFLLNHSDSGFIDFDEYKTTLEAEKAYEKLYIDGWGQSEFDIFLSFDRGRWHAFDGDAGKEIPCWANQRGDVVTRERVLAAISLHMRNTGCYPNVWEVNDHGNVTNVGSEVW